MLYDTVISMASVHILNGSKYYRAALTINGKRTFRSTKTTSRREAQALADSWQREIDFIEGKASSTDALVFKNPDEIKERLITGLRDIASGEFTPQQANEILSTMLEAGGYDPLPAQSTREFFESWLTGARLVTKARSFERYQTVVKKFLAALGKRADKSIRAVTLTDIEAYRDARMRGKCSPATVATDVKMIRAIFTKAKNAKIIRENPCDGIRLKTVIHEEREVFAVEEIDIILNHCTPEWKILVLLGFYGGMRLGDAASLEWDCVDFETNSIKYTQQKIEGKGARRGKASFVMAAPLRDALEAISTDTAERFVTPGLAKRVIPGRSGLSAEFSRILSTAGIDLRQTKQESGRSFSRRSFHSMRHSCATNRAAVATNISEAMLGTGHTDMKVFSTYAGHASSKAQKEIADKLPRLKARDWRKELHATASP